MRSLALSLTPRVYAYTFAQIPSSLISFLGARGAANGSAPGDRLYQNVNQKNDCSDCRAQLHVLRKHAGKCQNLICTVEPFDLLERRARVSPLKRENMMMNASAACSCEFSQNFLLDGSARLKDAKDEMEFVCERELA